MPTSPRVSRESGARVGRPTCPRSLCALGALTPHTRGRAANPPALPAPPATPSPTHPTARARPAARLPLPPQPAGRGRRMPPNPAPPRAAHAMHAALVSGRKRFPTLMAAARAALGCGRRGGGDRRRHASDARPPVRPGCPAPLRRHGFHLPDSLVALAEPEVRAAAAAARDAAATGGGDASGLVRGASVVREALVWVGLERVDHNRGAVGLVGERWAWWGPPPALPPWPTFAPTLLGLPQPPHSTTHPLAPALGGRAGRAPNPAAPSPAALAGRAATRGAAGKKSGVGARGGQDGRRGGLAGRARRHRLLRAGGACHRVPGSHPVRPFGGRGPADRLLRRPRWRWHRAAPGLPV